MPNRIEVADTNLLFNQRTYVRCLIAGLPTPSGEGYPREMTSKAIERIQELILEGCKIMLSHGLIQVSGDKAKDNLQQAIYNVNTVLHQLDQKIIYLHYDFKHLTEKYFEIGMKLNDFSIQLVKYCTCSFAF